jgi:hypothetical protein
MASIALIVLANSFYDPSNSRESLHEIQSKLNAYKNAPVQTVEAVIGALQHLDMLTSSGQVLCLSLLEQSINASFQSLPDEARGLVYQALLKLALPDGTTETPISAAVQSVASKVLARVVALSYAVTFEPFMTALMAQLRAPFTGAAAAGDPAAMSAAIGKAGQVQQGLRLLYECLVMWLSDSRSAGGGGVRKGGNAGNSGGDPFQASIRMARTAVLTNMPSVLELLMALLSLRPSSPSTNLTSFDRDITQQILSIFEHLAQALPDPSAILAREDLLGMLSSLSWAVVQPTPADGETTAALTVAQDTASSAVGVITILVQRGLTTNSAAAVAAVNASLAAGNPHQVASLAGSTVLTRMRVTLMGLCTTLMTQACGGSSSGSSTHTMPDLATAYSRLSSLEDACSWSLRSFVEASVTYLLPAVENTSTADSQQQQQQQQPFSALDFCTVLFTYTLAQSSSEAFISLLGLWGQLAERVCSSSSSSPSSASHSSYVAAFRGLAAQLLAKVLYSTNAAGLELLSEDTAVGDDEDEEEALGAGGAVVGVQFGGTSSFSGADDDDGNYNDGPGGPLRGPPSLHRVSTAISSRTRLPSSAYTLRPLHISTSAFAAANAVSVSGSSSGADGGSSGVHTPSAGSSGAGGSSASSSSNNEQDEDDEMLLANSLAQGTVLAEVAGGDASGDADGDGADGSGIVASNAGDPTSGGINGSGNPRLSERARYIESSLLLLSKLSSSSSEIHSDVMQAAGSSLQASCSALVAAIGGGAGASSSSSSSSPLSQHASDVSVLFALLSDLAQSSPLSAGATGAGGNAETQKAIITMATQMLSLAVSQSWILVKTLPLLRVMASSLLTVRAFLPTLDSHAKAAIYSNSSAVQPSASLIGLDSILSFLKDSVSCCLQLLDTSVLPPPPAVITDACIALLVRLSQQPVLRVVSRSSALPGLHDMLFPSAVIGDLTTKLQASSAGAVINTHLGWHKMMASLPASHQSHALLAGLRFALASLPPAMASSPSPFSAGAAGSASGGAAASPLTPSPTNLTQMGSALMAADASVEARSAAAHALLSPFLTAIHDALSTPSTTTPAASTGPAIALTAAIVSPVASPTGGSSSLSSLSARLSRAVGLLCAVLSSSRAGGGGPSTGGGAASSSSSSTSQGGGGGSGGLLGEGNGIGSSLQSVIAPLLAPILTTSCAVVCQLVDAASSPLSTALIPTSGSGNAPPPLISCGELLRLFAASVGGALRRSFPDDYLLQALTVVGPQLIRLKELAGETSSVAGSGSSTTTAAAKLFALSNGSGSSRAGAGSGGSGAPARALAGLLPCILYLLRLLRACAAPGAVAVPLASPPSSASASSGAASASASSSLRSAIMAAVAGPVKAMAASSSSNTTGESAFRFSEEIAPCSMTLARTVLRNQWRYLLSSAVTVDPTTNKRIKTFVSQEAANSVYACLSLFVSWIGNASASPELFRFALLNILAVQRETGNSLWNLPSIQEQSLPEMEVVLLDVLLKGERPTLSDEVVKACVAMAMTHREDFVARVLPAWMGKALGAENIASVIGRLDPAVGATLTSQESNAEDYSDSLLCLISAVRSWQLIKQEAMAVAAGTTVPVY